MDTYMKQRNYRVRKLLALLACCIAASGCGSTDSRPVTAPPATEEAADDQTADEAVADTLNNGEVTDNELTDAEPEPAIPDTAVPDTDPAAQTASGDELISGEQHSIVGIITDATAYSIAIQVPEGDTYYLTIPESGVTGNLNYITIGQIATLTYRGSLDENHAALMDISDSSLITGIYVEEYAFAIKIINAYRTMNMKALSDLTNFPVFLETGDFSSVIDTSGEFQVIDGEKIFTEALMERIVNYNLFDLEYTEAGFVMGKGTPSITFDVDDDGILGIIGINCNPAPDSTQN